MPIQEGERSGTWSHEELLRALGQFGLTGTSLYLLTFQDPAQPSSDLKPSLMGKPGPASHWAALTLNPLAPTALVVNKWFLF